MLLSVILTMSVLLPDATNETVILDILFGGAGLGGLIALGAFIAKRAGPRARRRNGDAMGKTCSLDRRSWRMLPLAQLQPLRLSAAVKIWMFVLRAYLVLAAGLILFRIATLAIGLA